MSNNTQSNPIAESKSHSDVSLSSSNPNIAQTNIPLIALPSTYTKKVSGSTVILDINEKINNKNNDSNMTTSVNTGMATMAITENSNNHDNKAIDISLEYR